MNTIKDIGETILTIGIVVLVFYMVRPNEIAQFIMTGFVVWLLIILCAEIYLAWQYRRRR